MAYGDASIGDLTPDRETRITFGKYRRQITQPAYVFDRVAGEIGASLFGDAAASARTGATHVLGLGIQLASTRPVVTSVFDTLVANWTPITTGVSSILAAGMQTYRYWRPFVATGVVYDGEVASGGQHLRKIVAAGDSWDSRLSADETSFDQPFPGDDIVNLDRVVRSIDVADPRKTIMFWFTMPSNMAIAGSSICTLYFSGPVGSDPTFYGYGQYAMKFFGDGTAILYERGRRVSSGLDIWVRRWAWQYASSVVGGQLYMIDIHCNVRSDCQTGELTGDKIVCVSSFGGKSMWTALLRNQITLSGLSMFGEEQLNDRTTGSGIYRASNLESKPLQEAPYRIDQRRDARISLSLAQHQYQEEAELDDSVIVLPFIAKEPADGTAHPFILEWYADTPSGTTCDVKLFNKETGAEVPDGDLVISDCLGGRRSYPVPSGGLRKVYAKIRMTGNVFRTPTLLRYRLKREAISETPDVTPVVVDGELDRDGDLPERAWHRISLNGPAEDPQGDTGSFVLSEFAPADNSLQIASGTPIEIAVYRPSDNTLLSILHRGVLGPPSSEPLADGSTFYPLNGAQTSHTSVGEFARLKRRLAPERMAFWDQDANRPMKVTDAIKWVFRNAGESVIDVGDLPVRLFGTDQQQLMVEPSTPLADIAQQLAFDYLHGFLVFDPNAGSTTDGMWRMIRKPKPPYKVLARFVRTHPGALKLPTDITAYGTSTIDGRTVGHIPILSLNGKTTERITVEPPEGNRVTVYGSAPTNTPVATQGVARLTASAWNFQSYNALGLASSDPAYPTPDGNPEYLGEEVPIEVFDASLNTQDAVNWVCRRVAEFAFPSRTRMTFVAPLVFIVDPDDAYQVNPRPLRFGDAVQVLNRDGSTWDTYVVSRVSPTYEVDHIMTAAYELVTSTRATEYSTPLAGLTKLSIRKKHGRAASRTDVGMPAGAATGFSANRQISIGHSSWMGLPTAEPTPIQDVDPGSADFGKFLFMADYV